MAVSPEIVLRSSGDLKISDVEAALKSYFHGRSVSVRLSTDSVKSQASAVTDTDLSASDDIIISTLTPNLSSSQELEELQNLLDKLSNKLDQKEAECCASTDKALKAMTTVQTFHAQQKEMFEEFRILRARYDEQKMVLQDILWRQCATHHPDLKAIPSMEAENFPETDTSVGEFSIGNVLGEGQFATVMNCVRNGTSTDLALKVINKDKILTFNSLRHVSNEIEILRGFQCNHIIRIEDIMQTQNRLYIVTEKGGLDLFEFFDEHPDGVSEEWAQEIIGRVLRGVYYIHHQGICHRDLKPENILMTFDRVSGKCVDLKLCDFGLASKFEPGTYLNDFCGSPGFFAPEMIIRGSYYGDKADIWSCGCILLELTLGHEKFCDTWMTAYDYDILQDKAVFAREIRSCIERLSDSLTFSHELNEFIVKFLRLRSSLRPSIGEVCRDLWLRKLGLDDLDDEQYPDLSPQGSPTPEMNMAVTNRHSFIGIEEAISNTEVDPDIIRSSFASLSERERKLYDTHNKTHTEGHHDLHLPPIEPATPNMSAARKILRKGEQLITSTQRQDSDRWNVTPLSFRAPADSPDAQSSPVYLDSPVMRRGFHRPSLPDVGEMDEESEKFGIAEKYDTSASNDPRSSTYSIDGGFSRPSVDGSSSKSTSGPSEQLRRRGSATAAERALASAAELAGSIEDDIRRESVDLRASMPSKLAAAGEGKLTGDISPAIPT